MRALLLKMKASFSGIAGFLAKNGGFCLEGRQVVGLGESGKVKKGRNEWRGARFSKMAKGGLFRRDHEKSKVKTRGGLGKEGHSTAGGVGKSFSILSSRLERSPMGTSL